MPTGLIEKFNYETQRVQEFSTIGLLIAREISRFIYADKLPHFLVNEDFNRKVDPAYSEKPNIFGLKLDEKVGVECFDKFPYRS